MRLRGIPPAQAIVSDLRFITDDVGTFQGCFRYLIQIIPPNPTFENGRNTWRFTNSATNSQLEGSLTTAAEHIFYSQGDLDNIQETTLSLQNVGFETEEFTQNRELTDTSSTTSTDSDTFETVNTNSSTEVETVEIEEVIIEENQQDPPLKPSLLGRRTISMSILLMFSSSRLMRQRLLPSKSERMGLRNSNTKVLAYSETIISGRILLLLKMARLHTQFN